MENNRDYLSVFRYYNEKGERLSVFAKAVDPMTLDVTILTCSKKDTFSRKEGRRRFEEKDFKVSEQVMVPIEEGKAKKSLIMYLRKNFYRPTMIDVQIELLVRGDRDAKEIDCI